MNKIDSKTAEKWDHYWKEKKDTTHKTYDFIAHIYRVLIIKRALNCFINKNFKEGASLLHTGCGTGQVDSDLRKTFKITGLDISEEALRLYKKTNGNNAEVIKADVKNMPKMKPFDGIYNLGLMEHFTMEENELILKQFNQILKPDGRIVLFWPPKYGISVIFLNSLHFFLNKVLRLSIRLHPDEISLLKSKEEVNTILKKSGFKMTDFYFGPKDMLTHRIIVAKKL